MVVGVYLESVYQYLIVTVDWVCLSLLLVSLMAFFFFFSFLSPQMLQARKLVRAEKTCKRVNKVKQNIGMKRPWRHRMTVSWSVSAGQRLLAHRLVVPGLHDTLCCGH